MSVNFRLHQCVSARAKDKGHRSGQTARRENQGQFLIYRFRSLILRSGDALQPAPVCATRPCENGGSCRPAHVRQGFKCLCESGFVGRHCEKPGTSCTNGCPSSFTLSADWLLALGMFQPSARRASAWTARTAASSVSVRRAREERTVSCRRQSQTVPRSPSTVDTVSSLCPGLSRSVAS